MTKTSRTTFLWFRTDNRKSAIQNPKWWGLSAIAFVLVAAGAVAQAQQPAKVPRIGFLTGGSPAGNPQRFEALREGLRELGYVEGKNIAIEGRFADGKFDRLPSLAAELVRLDVAVILTAGGISTRAAKRRDVYDSHRHGTG